MSYIDALIAQGGSRPFDAAGTMSKVNTLQNQQKRNELLDIGIAQAPVLQQRATEQYDQKQAQHDRGLLFQASNEFLRSYSVSKESAMQTLAGFPDEGRLGQIKQEALAALQSPDPADDEEVLKQAQMFVQLGTDEGFFGQEEGDSKAAPVGHPFGVQYKDPQTGETVQGTAFIRNDSGSGTTQMMFLGQNGQPVQGVTEWKRTNTSGQTPSQEANTDVDEATRIAVAKEKATTDAIPARSDAETLATRKKEAGFDLNKRLSQKQSFNALFGKVTSAFKNTNYFTVGAGGLLSVVPGSDAKAMKQDLSSILSDVAFDRLQKMRDNSPTGGALGQVSNFEIDLLKASLTGISQLTDPDKFKSALLEIRQFYKNLEYLNDINIDVTKQIRNAGSNQEILEIEATALQKYEDRLTKQGRQIEYDWDSVFGGSGRTMESGEASSTREAIRRLTGINEPEEQSGELTPRQQEIADLKAQLGETP